jgi:hypothetical protein
MPSRVANRTYGTVSADKRKQMTGLEFVQGLADATLPLNTIARTQGVRHRRSGERARVTAEPKDTHLNPAGTVHGGLAATVARSFWMLVRGLKARGTSPATNKTESPV